MSSLKEGHLSNDSLHLIVTNCQEPKHNSFRTTLQKKEGDEVFKCEIDESTDQQTYSVTALLYLHNDGTFDYSLDGYSANDEMGSTITNSFFGVWNLVDNSLTLTPVYKHKYLSEGWELIDNKYIEMHTVNTNNYDGNSILAWNPSNYTDTITCFLYKDKKEVATFKKFSQP
ncbi:predicted protein [Naegleria gruberi]|uniref:Predicted protein n=1 Tax=Naegleria gruberi TaxID=5762 RepID=D2VH89_NAEGR|nr:uncharacterized protein NAEGRDRAFT_68129 [Naegleria gruberi]EFC43756.1 predicted protein [Naegleria gruberi]|eukprot:XP_002676500.1 predicted protein [Naegleria gruberi strain NEG-M]